MLEESKCIELPVLSSQASFEQLTLPVLRGLNLHAEKSGARDSIGYLRNASGIHALEERIQRLSSAFSEYNLVGLDFRDLEHSYIRPDDSSDVRKAKRAELRLASAYACDAEHAHPLRNALEYFDIKTLADSGNNPYFRVNHDLVKALSKIAQDALKKFESRSEAIISKLDTWVKESLVHGSPATKEEALLDIHHQGFHTRTLQGLFCAMVEAPLYSQMSGFPKVLNPQLDQSISWEFISTDPMLIVHALRHMQRVPGRRFADLGSGPGSVALPVALLTNFEVFGYELEQDWVEMGSNSADKLGLPNAQFVQHDLTQDEFPEADIYFLYSPFKPGTPEIQGLVRALCQEAEKRPITIWAHYTPLVHLLEEATRTLTKVGTLGHLAAFQSSNS